MLRRFRIFVSVSAALPVALTDGVAADPVFNFRGSLDTAHFLGHLFRTLSQVLRLTANGGANDRSEKDASDGAKNLMKDAEKSGLAQKKKKRRRKGISFKASIRKKSDIGAETQNMSGSMEPMESFNLDKAPSSGKDRRRRHPAQTNAEHLKLTAMFNSGSKLSKVKSSTGHLVLNVTATLPPVINIDIPTRHLMYSLRSHGPFFRGSGDHRTRWDDTASTLLHMTSIFLRNMSKNVIEDPINAFVVSKLFELTSEEAVESSSGPISSTINWTCTVALHLLHLQSQKKAAKSKIAT